VSSGPGLPPTPAASSPKTRTRHVGYATDPRTNQRKLFGFVSFCNVTLFWGGIVNQPLSLSSWLRHACLCSMATKYYMRRCPSSLCSWLRVHTQADAAPFQRQLLSSAAWYQTEGPTGRTRGFRQPQDLLVRAMLQTEARAFGKGASSSSSSTMPASSSTRLLPPPPPQLAPQGSA
jgi:hypothetical protein